MEPQLQTQLLKINQHFYDRFASSFSNTRNRAQPGVQKIAKRIGQTHLVLDVGCGNGTFAKSLAEQGFSGQYLGIDMSKGLITSAKSLLDGLSHNNFNFQLANIADPTWQTTLPGIPYDWLVSFAVLHHLPGDGLRRQTVQAFAELVSPESQVAVSVWQWQNSPRLRKRVVPWSTVGLDSERLDEGDVLLDWRADDIIGYRYVHTFDEHSLDSLAREAGFRVRETFYSDGKTGDLALYQVWQLEV